MKRYDTVYFYHKISDTRTVVKAGMVVAINPDSVVVRPKGGDKIMVIEKSLVAIDRKSLPDL